ncbi:MAG: transaldolase [Actinomycetota bacterium]|nr:transaldolase [Candidatus Dormibacteraeota bacterium]MDQ6945138.1 transaldolase [Actinomycetota bacterium]
MSLGPKLAVERLRALGQSVWIDDLTREMIERGQLAELRDEGVSGITANPTTFDKAVTGSQLYDEAIKQLADRKKPDAILWDLLVEDVRAAADILRPVYDNTDGLDGFVSIEVDADIAYDSQRTMNMAAELWSRCQRPNIFIKIPATEPALPAIEAMLARGVNVNVTLIFSLARYQQVVEAFLAGMETRQAQGDPVEGVMSVASFFVSRVDAKVDAALRLRLAEAAAPEERQLLESLLGRIGIANSKLAYQESRRLHSGSRWERLASHGARVQRCLWASTSVKDPAYPATMYVEALAGPDTINTMPLKTYEALSEANLKGPALLEDGWATEQLQALEWLGIDLPQLTHQLEIEGVHSFAESYRHLIGGLAAKIEERGWNRVTAASQDSFPASDPPGWT